MMTKLEKLKSLCDRASSGPVDYVANNDGYEYRLILSWVPIEHRQTIAKVYDSYNRDRFIHAYNELPTLLALVEQMTEALEEYTDLYIGKDNYPANDAIAAFTAWNEQQNEQQEDVK